MSSNTADEARATSIDPAAGGPSWYSATTMSASPLLGSPSPSFAATRLTASTGSPNRTPSIPPGLTIDGVCSVTTPITPTVSPDTSWSEYSDICSPCTVTLAARYSQSVAGTMRSRRSVTPRSNSWFPTADAARPSALRTSIVGWSSLNDEANRVAPTLSPADSSRLASSPASARSVSMVSANATVEGWESEIRPWKSVMLSSVTVPVEGPPVLCAAAGGAVSDAAATTLAVSVQARAAARLRWGNVCTCVVRSSCSRSTLWRAGVGPR